MCTSSVFKSSHPHQLSPSVPVLCQPAGHKGPRSLFQHTAPQHRGNFPTLFGIRRRSAVCWALTTGLHVGKRWRWGSWQIPKLSWEITSTCTVRSTTGISTFYQLDYTKEGCGPMWTWSVKKDTLLTWLARQVRAVLGVAAFPLPCDLACCLSNIMSLIVNENWLLIVNENWLTNLHPRERRVVLGVVESHISLLSLFLHHR